MVKTEGRVGHVTPQTADVYNYKMAGMNVEVVEQVPRWDVSGILWFEHPQTSIAVVNDDNDSHLRVHAELQRCQHRSDRSVGDQEHHLQRQKREE